jgi:uncharacterized LabA/DUF88 family protein
MLRGMVFVDHLNFNIAVQDFYKRKGKSTPKLDYNTLFRNIVEMKKADYMKTIIFAPKPDDFLMKDKSLAGYYKWVQGIKNAKYIDVVEGRYIARQTDPAVEMNLNNRSSFYKVEKGTDINLALHAMAKAQNNTYDIAFILSADTDYISLYHQLKNVGKIVIAVAIKGQNLSKVIPEVDDYIMLNEDFFNANLRQNQ